MNTPTAIQIPFNRPPVLGTEQDFVTQAITSGKLSGDGPLGKACQNWFEQQLGCEKALMTPSCTHALEMSAILTGVSPGDEVIMPSYTFVSTANAFVLRGARIVFVDVDPATMNIDVNLIEDAITERTKVIVPVHYAGVGCDMDRIMEIANKHSLYVVEDAAQAVQCWRNDKPLGSQGHMSTFSFHETKNYVCGEGGMLVLNDPQFVQRAEIIREKGTNRSQFVRGEIDKYSWLDLGSSQLPSELQAGYLKAQLQDAERMREDRLNSWQRYRERLQPLNDAGYIDMPDVPNSCAHNAHILWFRCKDIEERTALFGHLKEKGIAAASHYVPLHSAPAGKKFGRFHGDDRFTTDGASRLLRLPMFFGLTEPEIDRVCAAVAGFYTGNSTI